MAAPSVPDDAYATALSRLAQLQSNRAVTSLFDPAPATAAASAGGVGGGVGGGGGGGKPADLNALAIPEMLAWLGRAGYTPASLAASPVRFVHVAGTKGKGSVSALIASILSQYPGTEAETEAGAGAGAGRVGLYASPHVLSVRERIVLDGAPIAPDRFARYAVTATVVTQLGIDHVGMLGDTVDKIAWHKSGIFKEGVKAFTRRLPEAQQQQQRGVMEVLRRRAREKGAVLVEVPDEEVERWGGVDGALLQGPFQKYNMALAVHAAREHLLRVGVRFEGRFGTDEWSLGDMPPEFVRGLREAALRGRCEVLRDAQQGIIIEWHVDGAHTDDSLAGVGRWFADRAGGDNDDGGGSSSSSSSVRVLLFNQQERDPAPLLRALLSGAQSGGRTAFDHAIFTRNEEEEPADGEERDLSTQIRAQETMQEAADGTTTTTVHNAVRPAVEQIRHIAAQAREQGKPCRVLVTGSFHLAGAVLKIIDHAEY
ncbi:Mur ligase [Thermothelomyces heterothallicus CBS 202.75]|uniref:Mur ligase n=1 Tax=Thermothelomyces heterothallicus CBS 202.75 TaxID=1149848 RepID=UPI0037438967